MPATDKNNLGQVNPPARICYLLDNMRRAGTEMRLSRLIDNYDRNRVVPFLCLLDGTSDDSKALEPNCEVLRLGMKSILRVSTIGKLRNLYHFLLENRIHVLEVYYSRGNIVGIPVGTLARAKCVTTFFSQGYWVRWIDRLVFFMYRPFISRMISNCSAAAQAGQELAFIPESKSEIIYNGIVLEQFLDIPYAERANNNKMISVGMVANLRPVKNPMLLVSAAKRILNSDQRIKFSIAGEGELKHQLMQAIDQAGLNSRFELCGSIEDIAGYLDGLDIAVISSHSEGMCNSLIEYMAAGRTIIATDVGGNSELIEHETTGLLVPDDDPTRMAEAIERLIHDPCLAQNLAQNARAKAMQQFNLASMTEQYEEFYQAVAHSR